MEGNYQLTMRVGQFCLFPEVHGGVGEVWGGVWWGSQYELLLPI